MKCIKKINFEIRLQTKNILITYIIFSQILMQSWLWILWVACPGSFVHAEKNSHLTVVIILTCGYNFKENQLYKCRTFLARNASGVMCPRFAVFFVLNIKLTSTKSHMVFSSIFRGKENLILRKEINETIFTHKITQRERQKNNTQSAMLPIL